MLEGAWREKERKRSAGGGERWGRERSKRGQSGEDHGTVSGPGIRSPCKRDVARGAGQMGNQDGGAPSALVPAPRTSLFSRSDCFPCHEKDTDAQRSNRTSRGLQASKSELGTESSVSDSSAGAPLRHPGCFPFSFRRRKALGGLSHEPCWGQGN